MFIHVGANEIRLTAVGSDEMDLLRRIAESGVHVQASDFSKNYCSSVVLAAGPTPGDSREKEEHDKATTSTS